jgi:hypothetical protein
MKLVTTTSQSGKTKYFGVLDEQGNQFMFASKKQALNFIQVQTNKNNDIQQYLQCELREPSGTAGKTPETTTCSCGNGVRDFSGLTPEEEEQNNQAIEVVLAAGRRAREASRRAEEARQRTNNLILELIDTDRELEQRRSQIEKLRKAVGSGHGHGARRLEPETVDVSSEEW